MSNSVRAPWGTVDHVVDGEAQTVYAEASCNGCRWNDDDNRPQALVQRARRHTVKTGHEVDITRTTLARITYEGER